MREEEEGEGKQNRWEKRRTKTDKKTGQRGETGRGVEAEILGEKGKRSLVELL